MGQRFQQEELESCEPERGGDLFLFKSRSPKAQWCRPTWVFTAAKERSYTLRAGPPATVEYKRFWVTVRVSYVNRDTALWQRSRQLWRVLRRHSGVDPRVLESCVREAMDNDPSPYHPLCTEPVECGLNVNGQEPNQGLM